MAITMEELKRKARAYDEALEKAKRLYEKGTITESLCHIFPELKESEDENIRKALIDFFGRGAKYGGQTNGVYDKDILAWLEKQGEQKPADSYCQENCKGFQETGKCFADGECKAKKEAKQKPVWKPTDEQMDALWLYAEQNNYAGAVLTSLYNDLKKLKG